MTDVTGQGFYRDEPVGTLLLNPLDATLVASYASSGTLWTTSATPRRSHPGAAITTAGAGDYDVTGLPRGGTYTVLGCNLLPPTGTLTTGIIATVKAGSLNAGAGTLTFETRRSDSGALAAPTDGSELHLVLRVETGAQ